MLNTIDRDTDNENKTHSCVNDSVKKEKPNDSRNYSRVDKTDTVLVSYRPQRYILCIRGTGERKHPIFPSGENRREWVSKPHEMPKTKYFESTREEEL